jgi:hypothetical protein
MMVEDGFDGGIVEDGVGYAKLRDSGHAISMEQMNNFMKEKLPSIINENNSDINLNMTFTISGSAYGGDLEETKIKIREIIEEYKKGKL